MSLSNSTVSIVHAPDSFMYIQQNLLKIYDVPMKFECKLIHGGPVHLCYRPV